MVTAWSAASRSRLWCSCRRAPRPMVSPSVAGPEGGVISDANLGFSVRAAQELRLVDHRDAERRGAVPFRARVGAHHDRRGLLGHAVRDVAARGFDQLLGL